MELLNILLGVEKPQLVSFENCQAERISCRLYSWLASRPVSAISAIENTRFLSLMCFLLSKNNGCKFVNLDLNSVHWVTDHLLYYLCFYWFFILNPFLALFLVLHLLFSLLKMDHCFLNFRLKVCSLKCFLIFFFFRPENRFLLIPRDERRYHALLFYVRAFPKEYRSIHLLLNRRLILNLRNFSLMAS